MTTNSEVEAVLGQKIPRILVGLGLLPDGYQCEVHLHRGRSRKRRDDEFQGTWDPETDSIRIAFSPKEEEPQPVTPGDVPPANTADPGSLENRLADLVRALDRAERRPGYEFVSLKWLRDSGLLAEGPLWVADPLLRHDALREAIDRRWILTSKVANPRPPHFPVTAIRLNRQMPDVRALLGDDTGHLPEFRPVSMRGEPLSATVLRDRR
jgi:hypothetical protein